jgi:hypothetical protein
MIEARIMTRVKLALLLASALALGACATAAQREVARMNKATTAAVTNIDACWQRVESSAPYRALKGKLPPPDGSAPPVALLFDQTKPTPEEAALLLALRRDYVTPCRKLALEDTGKIVPSFAAVMAKAYADADADFDRLARREVSWGDYALGVQRRREALGAAFGAAATDVNRDLVRSHVQEIQRRQGTAPAVQP